MIRRLMLVLSLLTLVAAGLRVTAAPQVTADGDRLLAAARHKAVDDGDLPAAIEMYQRIVSTSGSNRALAASALLGMAECYEKMGRPEARETYDLIAKSFAGTTAAHAASAKLAGATQVRLAFQSGPFRMRQPETRLHPDSVLSPDGTRVIDGVDGVVIRDLESGRRQTVLQGRGGGPRFESSLRRPRKFEP
jgi:hypothetical protein